MENKYIVSANNHNHIKILQNINNNINCQFMKCHNFIRIKICNILFLSARTLDYLIRLL